MDGKAKQTLFMSQLKPGMGCTLDEAAPDNKAVERGSGRGWNEEEEGCPRERQRERKKENCKEKEIGESLSRGDGDGKCWTIERRPLGSELSALVVWDVVHGLWILRISETELNTRGEH